MSMNTFKSTNGEPPWKFVKKLNFTTKIYKNKVSLAAIEVRGSRSYTENEWE